MKTTKEDRKAIVLSIWLAVLGVPISIFMGAVFGFLSQEGGIAGAAFIITAVIIYGSILIYWSGRYINKKDKN